ncbi:MAG: cupin domain-containing protein [Candidatus Marinimicrobia bacterium]|nr:cupin domain-containing protein [Candidatus Neomarinimicrobiota bacterium]MCF7827830.1 cupin domain-containing protein [Candidatus Neomarinimicrobiota bacterium]MCF7879415.1 cupin domain-containing protein [Candidatus Neomarinimicrobiota bacterium]
MKKTAEDWIEHLDLEPHPEGGFYKEVYRAEETISEDALPDRYSGERNFGTSIYYLLRSEDISHLHRLKTDEVWHFYAGSRLNMHLINDEGDHQQILLGNNPVEGEQLQIVIPHGAWFGSIVDQPDSYTLVACTLAPGFDFADFELGERKELLREYPEHKKIIRDLTID